MAYLHANAVLKDQLHFVWCPKPIEFKADTSLTIQKKLTTYSRRLEKLCYLVKQRTGSDWCNRGQVATGARKKS